MVVGIGTEEGRENRSGWNLQSSLSRCLSDQEAKFRLTLELLSYFFLIKYLHILIKVACVMIHRLVLCRAEWIWSTYSTYSMHEAEFS